jgi:truncated hemoglobin YjbI
MNYTVAKVTQDCDFTEPSTITLKVPKQELSNVTYYVHREKYHIDKADYDNIGQPRDKMSEVVTAYRKSEDDDILTTLSQRMYDDLLGEQKRHYTAFETIEYSRLDRYESKYQNDAYKNKHTIEEIRQELIDVLDENGQTVWEETGETQPVYTLVDHGTYKAALVTCKLI